MNQTRQAGHWPRLIEGAGLEPRLESDLQAGLRACTGKLEAGKLEAGELDAAERVARGAARRVVAELDARQARVGPLSILFWSRRLLLPRRMLAALGLALLVQLGVAMAEELEPRAAVVRIGDWLERRVASLGGSRHWLGPGRGPAPSTAAERDDAEERTPPTAAAQAVVPAEEEAHAAALDAPPLRGPSPLPSAPALRHRGAAGARRVPGPAPAPSSDQLGHEAGLVSRVVALAGENPPGALGLLAEYWRDYPTGDLRGEAAVAEVSALRSLGKNGEALLRLDGWAADGFHGMNEAGGELALTRLELMVGAGRCSEALPLLERDLAVTGGGHEETSRRWGRALLARAACKGKLGDAAGNRADLERYLRALPDGPRARQVRRALGIGD